MLKKFLKNWLYFSLFSTAAVLIAFVIIALLPPIGYGYVFPLSSWMMLEGFFLLWSAIPALLETWRI